MNSAELFVLSEQALTKVVDQIRDDQWDLKTPPEFSIQPGDWTVRSLINYHAYDNLPDELIQESWDYLKPNAAWLRSVGVMGPEVKVADDAPLFERLLGLTGRRPK